MDPHRALKYARARRPIFIAELKDFLRFPTVSSQPKHANDLRKCAYWLANHLRRIGLPDVRVIPTAGHPIVYAAWQRAPSRPTLLIYGHYDVQTPEPLHEWRSPPFDPQIRGDYLYGRGACDDKGQSFTHVKALESYLQTGGSLPVNVKCIFEGEEELGGSSRLQTFVRRNREALRAHAAIVSDSRMLGPDRPSIGYAQRGDLRLELHIFGPKEDLHSGNFGGAVHNPIQALCEIVATLHDSEGRVAVPGFYDKVRQWSDKERDYMRRTGPKDAAIFRNAAVPKAWGEKEYSLYERTTIRPALTLSAISGGYRGPGMKTVIPASASLKIGIRLVPDQDPVEIDRLFQEHIAQVTPPTVTARIQTISASNPVFVDRAHRAIRTAAFAYRKGFGSWPVFLRSGGSISSANVFQKVLGIPTVLMGFGSPDDRMHSPNEKFYLPNFFRGIETSIWYFAAAAKLHPVPREHRQKELQNA